MNIQTYYVLFHRAKPTPRRMFGHVEVCGVTDDDEWFFLNPALNFSDLDIVYRKEQVEAYLAVAFEDCLVLRTEPGPGASAISPIMTCATVVGHIIGFRAFTPWGLRRKLLRNGAKEVFNGWSSGK